MLAALFNSWWDDVDQGTFKYMGFWGCTVFANGINYLWFGGGNIFITRVL